MSIKSRVQDYGKVLGDWDIDPKPIGHGSRIDAANETTQIFRISRHITSYTEERALKVVNIIMKHGKRKVLAEKEEYQEEYQDKRKKAERELELMYKLRGSSNVVFYYDCKFKDWDEEDKFGCDLLITMDLHDNLSEKMEEGTVYTEDQIIDIGIDICEALKQCHKNNIIHRDIKPQNIFIDHNGKYLLGDFGISKILETRDSEMSTSTGTRAYAAPEQFQLKYDSRVDIYSLGLVLYQLSSENRLPFTSKTGYVSEEAITRRVKCDRLPEVPNISSRLNDIILKACAHNVEDRYQSAEAFYDALEELKNEREESVKKTTEESQTVSEKDMVNELTEQEKKDAEIYSTKIIMQVQTPKTEQELEAEKEDKDLQTGLKEAAGGHYDNAVAWFEKSSNHQNSYAQYNLGVCYYKGLGVSRDYGKAAGWFEKSASQGNSDGAYCLGICYYNGDGVEKDYKKAVKYFEESAVKGNYNARCNLGVCYYNGDGVAVDERKAAELFRESAAQGSSDAKEHLCRMGE